MTGLIPAERFYKSNWVQGSGIPPELNIMIKDPKPNILLPGDSIVAGLSRYPNVSNQYLGPVIALNLGIGGNRVENVIWLAIDLLYRLLCKILQFCAEPIMSQ